MTPPPTPVALIGAGNIGGGVLHVLTEAGWNVTAHDANPDLRPVVEAAGAGFADTAAAAVTGADIVLTSLPGPKQIAAVGREILPVLAEDRLWIELSTNDLGTARQLAADAAAVGVRLIDAPVSGGPEGARAGTLSIFVGGDDAAVADAMPLLQTIGTKVDHLGAHGAGIVAKIAQVTLCYTQTVTLIEALLLGVKGGVAPEKMLDLIVHSAGTSYSATAYGPEILAGTYDASFPLSHALKDLRLAMDMADTLGLTLPFTRDVTELYAEAAETFGATAAHCLAAQLLERRNDLVLHERAAARPEPSGGATDNNR